MPKLIIKNGSGSAESVEVSHGLTLGRLKDLAVCIRDGKASREHAQIVMREAGFSIVDLKSTNGTFVNGSRVAESALQHGDRIRIGETVILFQDPPAEPAALEAVPVSPAAPPAKPKPVGKKIDLGLPPPQKIKLDLPPPKKVNVKLKPTKTRRDRIK